MQGNRISDPGDNERHCMIENPFEAIITNS